MDNKKRLIIFISSFVIALLFWRLRVFLFYNEGNLSFLRAVSGLQIHHYHFGIIILTVALLLYLFYERNNITLALLGFGLGSILDSFIPRLFKSGTRIQEIANYNTNFYNSLVLFSIIIVFCIILYQVKNIKSKKV